MRVNILFFRFSFWSFFPPCQFCQPLQPRCVRRWKENRENTSEAYSPSTAGSTTYENKHRIHIDASYFYIIFTRPIGANPVTLTRRRERKGSPKDGLTLLPGRRSSVASIIRPPPLSLESIAPSRHQP